MFNWTFAPLVMVPMTFGGITVPLSHDVSLTFYEAIVPRTITNTQSPPAFDITINGFLVKWSIKF